MKIKMNRKRLLILGCSHSVGVYSWNSKIKKAVIEKTDGWPMRICEKYHNYDVYIVSWPGGGIINYVWFLGYIARYHGKDFFDKIIIQISNEPRLTLYDYRFTHLFDKRWTNVDKSMFFLFYNLRTICYPLTKEVIFDDSEKFVLDNLDKSDITELSDINELSKCYHFIVNQPLEVHMDNSLPPADQLATLLDEKLCHNLTGAAMINLGYYYSTIDNMLDLILSAFDKTQLFLFAFGRFDVRWNRIKTNFKSAYNISDDEFNDIMKKSNENMQVYDLIRHIQSRGFYMPNSTARDYITSVVGKKQELLLTMPDGTNHYNKKGNNLVYKFLECDNLLYKFMNNE